MSNDRIKPFDAGGYFPIHNYVFDVCMPQLSNAGWRILCVAIRKTWGWIDREDPNPMGRKTWDQISYSQFQEASGLRSAASVSKGLQECIDLGYMLRKQIGYTTGIGSPVFAYALNVDFEIPATDSVAGNAEHKRPASESVAGGHVPASENELGPASVFEDTKVKEKQIKDEKKVIIPSAWGKVLAEIQLQTTAQTFDAWFGDSRIIATDNGTWTVQLGSKYALDWAQNQMRTKFDRAMSRHAPGIELEFVA